MPTVEVFEKDQITPLFQGDFPFLPRKGEYISKDAGGHFNYYNVVEVWHREDAKTGAFRACIRVEIDE